MDSQNRIGQLLAAVVSITEKHQKANAEVRDQARCLLDRHQASIAPLEPMRTAAAGMRLRVAIDDGLLAEAQTILARLS